MHTSGSDCPYLRLDVSGPRCGRATNIQPCDKHTVRDQGRHRLANIAAMQNVVAIHTHTHLDNRKGDAVLLQTLQKGGRSERGRRREDPLRQLRCLLYHCHSHHEAADANVTTSLVQPRHANLGRPTAHACYFQNCPPPTPHSSISCDDINNTTPPDNTQTRDGSAVMFTFTHGSWRPQQQEWVWRRSLAPGRQPSSPPPNRTDPVGAWHHHGEYTHRHANSGLLPPPPTSIIAPVKHSSAEMSRLRVCHT